MHNFNELFEHWWILLLFSWLSFPKRYKFSRKNIVLHVIQLLNIYILRLFIEFSQRWNKLERKIVKNHMKNHFSFDNFFYSHQVKSIFLSSLKENSRPGMLKMECLLRNFAAHPLGSTRLCLHSIKGQDNFKPKSGWGAEKANFHRYLFARVISLCLFNRWINENEDLQVQLEFIVSREHVNELDWVDALG